MQGNSPQNSLKSLLVLTLLHELFIGKGAVDILRYLREGRMTSRVDVERIDSQDLLVYFQEILQPDLFLCRRWLISLREFNRSLWLFLSRREAIPHIFRLIKPESLETTFANHSQSIPLTKGQASGHACFEPLLFKLSIELR